MSIKLFNRVSVPFKVFSIILFHLYATFQLASFAVQAFFLGHARAVILPLCMFSVWLHFFHRTLQATNRKKIEELYKFFYGLRMYVVPIMLYYCYDWFTTIAKDAMESRANTLDFISKIALCGFYMSLLVLLREEKTA